MLRMDPRPSYAQVCRYEERRARTTLFRRRIEDADELDRLIPLLFRTECALDDRVYA